MNESGIYPSGNRIVILPDGVNDKYDGLIELPENIEEEHALAQTIGTLVAVGPDCWIDHVERDGEGNITKIVGWLEDFAEVGDRVIFAKYGGLQELGKDGNYYRVMKDKDITATCDKEVNFSSLASRESF